MYDLSDSTACPCIFSSEKPLTIGFFYFAVEENGLWSAEYFYRNLSHKTFLK